MTHDQPLDVPFMLARVEVQVHADGFLGRLVGQLKGHRELPPRRVDEHHELRIPADPATSAMPPALPGD